MSDNKEEERPTEIPAEVELPDPMDEAYDPYKVYSGGSEELTMLGLYSPNNEQFDN